MLAETMIVTTLSAYARWRVAGPQLHVATSVGWLAANPWALCILFILIIFILLKLECIKIHKISY